MKGDIKNNLVEKIRNKLIVSCQALEGEVLYTEEGNIMPLMALAAKNAGAAGIRAQGVRDIVQIKKMVDLPIIGIIKRSYDGMDQYITATMKEVDELVTTGCEIIALDCTLRPRADKTSINDFIKEIKEKYPDILLMADISNLEEGINAEKAGVDFVGTTLSGYTPYTESNDGPDFGLIQDLSKNINIPIIAEGKIHYPEQAKKALECGAMAVVVGGAITRPQEIASRFVDAINKK